MSHFTEEDRIEPVYCLQCRNHTPRADLRGTICNTCVLIQQRLKEREEQEAAALAQQQAALAAIHPRPYPSAGRCPGCGSYHTKATGRSNTGAIMGGVAMTLLFAVCCFPVALIVLPILWCMQRGEVHVRCLDCGFGWRM